MKANLLLPISLFSLLTSTIYIFSFTPQVWGREFASNSPQQTIQVKSEDSEEQEKKSGLQGIPAQINEIAQRITVRIDAPNGNGSGIIFAFDREKKVYYVLTAKHVVEKEQNYQIVTPDDQAYPLDPNNVTKFANSDLAVISFPSEEKYDVARFGDYQFGLNEELWVFVYGWARANDSPQAQLTPGKIAGKETGIFLVKDELSFAEDNGYELVYTNLSQEGMSGGPVLDTNGRVIGIHASAEGERYQLVDKLQLGFSLGIPVGTFLNSDFTKNLISSQQVEIQTTKERLDIDPFAQPELSQEDIQSIQNNLTSIESPSELKSETEWLNYGNKLWRLSRYYKAAQAFDKATKNKKDFYQAYYGKGLAIYDLGNYQEAEKEFERVLKIKSDFYPALYRQSLCLLNLKRYDKALVVIDRAIQLKPENTALNILRGEALQNLARYTEAVDSYQKAIEVEENAITLVRKGSLYRILEKYDLALEILNKAARTNPKYIETYINRGLTYYQSGKYIQALADFNHAISLDREDSRGYLGRGFVNYKLAELNQSTVDFYRAFQVYNQNFKKEREIININSQANKYAQLKIDFNYVLNNDSTEGHSYLGKSVALFITGNNQKAVENLNKATIFFQVQEDNSSYKLTQAMLQQLQQSQNQVVSK